MFHLVFVFPGCLIKSNHGHDIETFRKYCSLYFYRFPITRCHKATFVILWPFDVGQEKITSCKNAKWCLMLESLKQSSKVKVLSPI